MEGCISNQDICTDSCVKSFYCYALLQVKVFMFEGQACKRLETVYSTGGKNPSSTALLKDKWVA